MTARRVAATMLLTVATAAVITGCSASEGGGAGDAPIARTENQGWVVLNNVDHYPNIAFRCFGPNGIYAPRTPDNGSGRPVVVVTNDPNCGSK